MFVRLASLGDMVPGLIFLALGLALTGGVVSIYCQRWEVSARRTGEAWDASFDLRLLYSLRYSARSLSGVTGLALSSGSSRRSSTDRIGTVTVNRLLAVTGEGDVKLTQAVPYGMPQDISDFVERVNSRFASGEAAFTETLVFKPWRMGDVFLYFFGGFFLLLCWITAGFLYGALFKPPFIKVEGSSVTYRCTGFSRVETVPVYQVTAFETGRGLDLSKVPDKLALLAGGREALAEREAREEKRTPSPPHLVMRLTDGKKVPFYGAAAKEGTAQRLADELNAALGLRPDRKPAGD